jgi:hypothetical protein
MMTHRKKEIGGLRGLTLASVDHDMRMLWLDEDVQAKTSCKATLYLDNRK